MVISNFENSFLLYAEYHQNNANKIIYNVTTPLIILTMFILGSYTGHIIRLPFDNYFPVEFNLSGLLTLFYSIYYIYLDLDNGFKFSIILWLNQFFAYLLYVLYPEFGLYSLGTLLTSLFLQYIGYIYCEKNTPKFIDGIFQTFIIGPFAIFIVFLDNIKYKHQIEFIMKNVHSTCDLTNIKNDKNKFDLKHKNE